MTNDTPNNREQPKVSGQPVQSTAVQILALLNRLSLNAYKSKDRQMLVFQVLNDTIQVIAYQRAILWNMEKSTPELMGVSGQAFFNKNSAIADKWRMLIGNLKSKGTIHQVSEESLVDKKELWSEVRQGQQASSSVLWLPIYVKDKLRYGLWLERWSGQGWLQEELEILEFLMKVYGAAFEKFLPKAHMRLLSKRKLLIALAVLGLLLFLIRIPLRVIAPAEVVPKDPVLITAPLNGIIAEMIAQPGQAVKKGQVLFIYDDRVTLDELKAARKQVEVIESQLHRASTAALEEAPSTQPFEFNTESPSSNIAVLSLQLQKEKIRLQLAESQALKLYVKSPIDGVAILDNPEEWRGHPVKIGERIMMVSDPKNTKIRMWIPESDNVPLDEKHLIKIILNISPHTSYQAKLLYVSSYSDVTEHGVPSFIADADWITPPDELKLGLKATAVLYGENVTLFYWMIRRPWTAIRNFIGI